ncbi:hypothetical protein POSPLADRAFT_1045686 [Postia placenta MAD-698-R-SB12]|uniref:RRM domain-containing protein n=1 Tax=Postia placenta MAD-698-R-SB12 TaxID=670580 RepID=A0A1X6N4H5_9APHY|nr:hypothetical protein POSPLADRAFT_1045686 [Postia placenta MAD-698-R-SB12]OSX63333.1 hypothetical protein POSPLADRAFT_1045686 [Postia placenta MAD-698-R-SB12]
MRSEANRDLGLSDIMEEVEREQTIVRVSKWRVRLRAFVCLNILNIRFALSLGAQHWHDRMSTTMDAVPELQRSNTSSSLEKRKAYSADIDEEKVMVMEASSVDEVGSDVKVIEKAEDVAIEILTTEDHPELPVWTFRTAFLGVGLSAFSAVLATIYTFKPQNATVSQLFCLIIAYVLGTFMAGVIPSGGYWKYLNPGPFNIKEHTAIVIMASTASSVAIAMEIIAALDLFYDITLNAGVAIFQIFASQMIGYGIAGVLRTLLVYPTYAFYPTYISVVNLLQSLHYGGVLNAKRRVSGADGCREIRRYFWMVFAAIFFWEWIPQYPFPLLTAFSIICLADNGRHPFVRNLFGAGSSNEGIGLFSFSTSWTLITQGSPLVWPLQTLGMAIGYLVLTLTYYHNVFNGRDLVWMSSALFGTDGGTYNQSAILTPSNQLDPEKLAEVGLPRFTTTYAISQMCYNVSLGAAIVHVLLWYWGDLKKGVFGAFGEVKFLRGDQEIDDPHYKGGLLRTSLTAAMKVYKEVPQWWYLTLFVISLAVGIGCSYSGHTVLIPWWSVILFTAISFFLAIVLGFIMATTGFSLSIKYAIQILAAFVHPGNPVYHGLPDIVHAARSCVVIGFAAQWWARKHRPAWFKKYNYLTSAALDGGSQVIMFILVGQPRESVRGQVRVGTIAPIVYSEFRINPACAQIFLSRALGLQRDATTQPTRARTGGERATRPEPSSPQRLSPASSSPHLEKHSISQASTPLSLSTTPPSPSTDSNSYASPRILLTPSESSSPSIMASPSAPSADERTQPPPSILSATAPKFQSRLFDAPIDIHTLVSDTPPPGRDQSISALVTGLQSVHLSTPSSTTPAQLSSTAKNHSDVQPTAPDQHAADPCTPNVYINGLPPNFPEADLYKMTCDFGAVVSVRTFTRHVCDRPSFETVDAAERCIETLRKYRNLHPSFAKQIHKIPGTVYSTSSFEPPANDSVDGQSRNSFKARMEQLKDTSSTNLYMEGLPLSTDERALSALVEPYRIMSSRFFRTRLNNPPRLIAFVRLESRVAAEKIIERLHGRHIRGWQEDGCRISVRFADTSEQRDLRRMERMTREGDQSPARITIAQAALLNLKGTQLGPTPSGSPDINYLPIGLPAKSPYIINGLGGGNVGGAFSPLARASPSLSYSDHINPLLNSMQDLTLMPGRQHFEDFNDRAAQYLGQDLRMNQLALQDELLALQAAQAQLQSGRGSDVNNMSGRADNGFTHIERLLLQAHAERQQAQELLLEAERERDLRDLLLSQQYDFGGASQLGDIGDDTQRRLLNILSPTSENDFHSGFSTSQGLQVPKGYPYELNAHGAAGGLGAAPAADYHSRSSPNFSQQPSAARQERQRNQTHASHARAETDAPAQALHTRSTTLPLQYLSSRGGSHHFLNTPSQNFSPSTLNSSIIDTRSTSINNTTFNLDDSIDYVSNSNNSARTDSILRNNLGQKNVSFSDAKGHAVSRPELATANYTFMMTGSALSSGRAGGASQSGINGKRTLQDVQTDEDDSLVSPALTYSPHTTASISPATPYSGFFPPAEGFDGSYVVEGRLSGVVEKQKMRANQ